jgi:hypothetical protein
MKTLSFIIILLFFAFTFAQKPENFACAKDDKYKIREYFDHLEEQNSFVSQCNEKSRKEILEKTGKPPIFISGGCEWINNGCPVNLVLPKFPPLAEKLKISGIVKVEIIIDREGQVVYAKALNGYKILHFNSLEAACNSHFYPKSFCEKPIMQKRIIHYNFIF